MKDAENNGIDWDTDTAIQVRRNLIKTILQFDETFNERYYNYSITSGYETIGSSPLVQARFQLGPIDALCQLTFFLFPEVE